MPIARWHVGKLVLFWIICVIGFLATFGAVITLWEEAGGQQDARATWDAVENEIQAFATEAGISRDTARESILAAYRGCRTQSLERGPTDIAPNSAQVLFDSLFCSALMRQPYREQMFQAHSPQSPSVVAWRLLWPTIALAGGFLLAPFIVTWTWFTAREARGVP